MNQWANVEADAVQDSIFDPLMLLIYIKEVLNSFMAEAFIV